MPVNVAKVKAETAGLPRLEALSNHKKREKVNKKL
jgi:hypothetical protein